MRNKRRVFITLFHRDEFSVGENRRKYGSGSYHWAILVAPKGVEDMDRSTCDSFDVTNGATVDPVRRVNLNPHGDWVYRHQHPVNPRGSSRYLCAIMIGKLSNDVDINAIDRALRNLAMPRREGGAERCVWWTKQGVRQLQSMHLAESFDVERLEADATSYGDQRMQDLQFGRGGSGKKLKVHNYTHRKL